MSGDETITIPADLWASGILLCGGVERLRSYARELNSASCGHTAARLLLEHLADEIERQAPRAEGWYSLRATGGERLLRYWSRDKWWLDEGVVPSAFRADPACYVIEPVTIGRADS